MEDRSAVLRQRSSERVGRGYSIVEEDALRRQLADVLNALEESESRFRLLFDHSRDPIWVADFDGNYLDCNSAAARLSRCSREGILCKNVRDFLPPDSSPSLFYEHRAVWTTGGMLETDFVVPDQVLRLELILAPTRWHGRPVVFGLGRDVTARYRSAESLRQEEDDLRLEHHTDELVDKVRRLRQEMAERVRAEQALRESEERFRAEYRAIPVPTYTWRRSGDDDFVLIDYNDAAMGITKGKIVNLLGISMRELYAERPQIVEQFERCNATRSTVREEMPYRFRSTGEDRHLAVTYAFVPPDLVMVHTVDVTERVQAEQAMKSDRRRLRRLLAANERERKLIAYEIHDGFVQQVTGAKMLLESLPDLIAKKGDEGWKTFEAALRSLGQGIAEARRLIRGLRPPGLDEAGLVAAIECLVEEMRPPGAPEIDLLISLGEVRLAPVLENSIFRIVQESLTNACRYSESQKILVRIATHRRKIRVEVVDWGRGFVPREVSSGHFGLQGIRERAQLLGGRASIRSAPGRGTHIRVELPLLAAGD